MINKGIVLAGGSGTRLYPITRSVAKPLLPIYDKPMVYYPLSVLMMAGIREILMITTPSDQVLFENLLRDGSHLGIHIEYAVQPEPKGIAQAFSIGENFASAEGCALVLGDNIFYGSDLESELRTARNQKEGATVFAYPVKNPSEFGVVEFGPSKKVISLEEKPEMPKSEYAVTGLYFYDCNAFDYVKELQPSARGELEITDLNRMYLERGKLKVQTLGQGYAWLDTGTNEALLEAANFIYGTEELLGIKIACLEEIAWKNGWIARDDVERLAKPLMKNSYGRYLARILKE